MHCATNSFVEIVTIVPLSKARTCLLFYPTVELSIVRVLRYSYYVFTLKALAVVLQWLDPRSTLGCLADSDSGQSGARKPSVA